MLELASYIFRMHDRASTFDFSGLSSSPFEGLCEVVWTVEAEVAPGKLLYLTGDPDVLGCWDPDMAILMSSSEDGNLWKAEVKVRY